MKRLLLMLLCAALLVGAAACQADDAPDNPPDEKEPAAQATLYLPNENADGFDTEQVELTEDSPQALVDALIERGALPEGTQVLDGFDPAADVPALDLSQPFGDAMSSTGTAGENMLMGALVNTFLDYYEKESISVTVQGQVIETGNNEYSQPMGRMDGGPAA